MPTTTRAQSRAQFERTGVEAAEVAQNPAGVPVDEGCGWSDLGYASMPCGNGRRCKILILKRDEDSYIIYLGKLTKTGLGVDEGAR